MGNGSDLQLFHDGSNSYVQDTAAGELILKSNGPSISFQKGDGTELMRVDTSGNVGIGTNTPSSYTANGNNLVVADVNVGITLASTSASGSGALYFADGTTGSEAYRGIINYLHASDAMGFHTGAAERMRIDSSGNIGIGTSSPTFTAAYGGLHVHSTYPEIHLTGTDSGSGASDGFKIQKNSANHVYLWNYENANLVLATNNTERMRIDSNGALLLGTTSRSIYYNSANVYNASAVIKTNVSNEVADLVITNGDNNFGSAVEFARTNSAGNDVRFATISAQPTNNTAGSEAGVIRFYTKDTGDSNVVERARLDASGNLLVGTTDVDIGSVTSGSGFSYKANNGALQIARQASSATKPALVLNTTGVDSSILDFRKDGSTAGYIGNFGTHIYIGGPSASGLYFGGSRVQPMSNGSLADNLIDMGHPSYRLDDIYASNTSIIGTSDKREKQDIAELDEAEQRVAVACKGLLRKFRWKDAVAEKGDDARIHFGIIAQDLQAAFAAEGLDAGRYGMFIHNTWWEHDVEVPAVEAVAEVLDEEGNVVTEAVEAKDAYTRTDTYETQEEAPEGAVERDRMGGRMTEILAFIIGAL